MIRARYGRLWTLAALAILIIIFLTGLRPAVPLKTPELPSWFPTKQQQEAFEEKVENAAQPGPPPPPAPPAPPSLPSPPSIAPRPPIAQATTKTEELKIKSSASSSGSSASATASLIPEQPVAEVAADVDEDALTAHAAEVAADVDDDAEPDLNTLNTLNEVAADVHDEHMVDYGNNADKHVADAGAIAEATTTTAEVPEPTQFGGAYAQSHPPPQTTSQSPKPSGSPSDADLEHLNLAQPGIQPPESTPAQANGLEPSTVADAGVVIQTAPSSPVDGQAAAAKVKRSKTVVVGRLNNEDTDWIGEELPDWQNAIYYVELPEYAPSPSGLRTRMNKAREAMPYLTYIIDHYPNFPDVVAFIHPHKDRMPYAWHTDARRHSAVNMLNDLKLSTVQKRGYVNLRCNNEVGCPDEIRPFRNPPHEEKLAEHAYSHVYAHFFHASEAEMRKQIPVVGTQCCAQFAVSREELLKRPKADYEHYRTYLEETEYDDATIGRVMEYMWHIIFGREAVHCEDVFECWCAVYGRCFVSELDKSWTGWLGLTPHPDVKPPED